MAKKISIQHPRSSVAGRAPQSTDILVGEIAINFADRKIYTRDSSDNIIAVNLEKLTIQSSSSTTPTLGPGHILLVTTDGTITGDFRELWLSDGFTWRRTKINTRVSSVIINNTQTDPDAITVPGRYLVPLGGTGIFAQHIAEYAEYNGLNWIFSSPAADDRVLITTGVNAGKIFRFNSGAWQDLGDNAKGIRRWNLTGAYAAGDLVINSNLIYQANDTIAANTAFAVNTAGNTWTQISTVPASSVSVANQNLTMDPYLMLTGALMSSGNVAITSQAAATTANVSVTGTVPIVRGPTRLTASGTGQIGVAASPTPVALNFITKPVLYAGFNGSSVIFAQNPTVRLTDRKGNPVSGIPVTISIVSNGSIAAGTTVGTSDANGNITFTGLTDIRPTGTTVRFRFTSERINSPNAGYAEYDCPWVNLGTVTNGAITLNGTAQYVTFSDTNVNNIKRISFSPNVNLTTYSYVVVGGGGAGGRGASSDNGAGRGGGGGEGGEVVTGNANVTITANLNVTVGAGGVAIQNMSQRSNPGGDSSITNGATTLTARGGQGGNGGNNGADGGNNTNGANGGDGGAWNGGAGTQGAVGTNNNITGAVVGYGGGGGGGGGGRPGSGAGGGAAGQTNGRAGGNGSFSGYWPGTAGVAMGGGGGGGGGCALSAQGGNGANGGDGGVIVRFNLYASDTLTTTATTNVSPQDPRASLGMFFTSTSGTLSLGQMFPMPSQGVSRIRSGQQFTFELGLFKTATSLQITLYSMNSNRSVVTTLGTTTYTNATPSAATGTYTNTITLTANPASTNTHFYFEIIVPQGVPVGGVFALAPGASPPAKLTNNLVQAKRLFDDAVTLGMVA